MEGKGDTKRSGNDERADIHPLTLVQHRSARVLSVEYEARSDRHLLQACRWTFPCLFLANFRTNGDEVTDLKSDGTMAEKLTVKAMFMVKM